MSVAYRSRRGRRPSTTDWLQVLDVDGPFLAAPVVQDIWPDGLPALDQGQMNALRSASTLYDVNPGTRDAFIRHVLQDVLDWRHNLSWGPDAAPLAVAVPEHHTTVDITFALRGQDAEGAVQDAPVLLGMVLPPRTATTGRAPAGSGTWTAGPADRLAHALRVRKVPLGIVTNGDTWTLVTMADAGAISTASWTRHAWLEEPQTLRAFVALLTRTRFYGVPAGDTLPGLLTKSLARQEEVTERLAEQSQAVVEMLVATLGRLDAHYRAEHGDRLLPPDVGPAEVYQAAVTVLMRLVFLLYAEERGLLPLDDDTYASAYAVNTLADSLRERATDHGEDALERSATGWYRLLALFRGVHRGARHEQLVLPAYGGSLFDPDRFPWLEGRASGDQPLGDGEVPAIDDRTLLKALDSLQTLQFAKERRQVSYRSLDVEQIGYVYEGLLDQDARTATDWVVSIAVSDKDPRKNGPELHLADLEAKHALGDEALAMWLGEQIKGVKGNRSKASILKSLAPPSNDDKRNLERLVREACGNDDAVTSRVMPFARLLRLDPRDLPVVYPPGSLYLTDSSARASTGAVYTPRVLAEQVVETTLEAIVYSPGPLDTEDKGAWVLKTPEQILDLKVCDIAAGSGAFLVAAARYLADRLLESRRLHAGQTPVAEIDAGAEGAPASASAASDLLASAQAAQEELDARRDVIAHCIYGVDINPMALEMSKLSLWLTSLDRNRPFSFLDDHLAVGDSLLGITSPQQLLDLHLDPKKGRALHRDALELFSSTVESDLKVAVELRAQITQTGDRDSRDAATKQRLLRRAQEVTGRLSMAADGLSAASLAGGKDSDYLNLASELSKASEGADGAKQQLAAAIGPRLLRGPGTGRHRPAHFPLFFPEVFTAERDGFDAIIGNPPFLHGGSISRTRGDDYRRHLVEDVAGGSSGTADYVAYFFLRASQLLAAGRPFGLIATNTVAQADTAEVGLAQLVARGTIFDARSSFAWASSSASVFVVTVHWVKGIATGKVLLDGQSVSRVGPNLVELSVGQDGERPARLTARKDKAFIGPSPKGAGFIIDKSLAESWLAADSSLADRLLPMLEARDLNRKAIVDPQRYLINVQDFQTEADLAASCPVLFDHLGATVKVQRASGSGRSAVSATRASKWWLYGSDAKRLYQRAVPGTRMAVVARHSPHAQPALIALTSRMSLNDSCIAWPDIDFGTFAMLCSSWQHAWLVRWGSTYKEDLRYGPTDVFETLPIPRFAQDIDAAGERLAHERNAAQRSLNRGLTGLYNLAADPACKLPQIAALREAHRAVDEAIARSFAATVAFSYSFETGAEILPGPRRFGPSRQTTSALLAVLAEAHSEQCEVGATTATPVSAATGDWQLFGEEG